MVHNNAVRIQYHGPIPIVIHNYYLYELRGYRRHKVQKALILKGVSSDGDTG